MKEFVGSYFSLLPKTPSFIFKRYVVCIVYNSDPHPYFFTSSVMQNLVLFQLVDVYRLLEDEIDAPSVALQVIQGKPRLLSLSTLARARDVNPVGLGPI